MTTYQIETINGERIAGYLTLEAAVDAMKEVLGWSEVILSDQFWIAYASRIDYESRSPSARIRQIEIEVQS
jgi:hypothetical protein